MTNVRIPRSRPRTRGAVVAIAALAIAVAGCAGSDGSATPDAPGRPTVTIVTYDSYVLDPDVESAIEERLGVEIEVSASGDGAEALAAAILTAGRPEGDLFFGVDNVLLTRALAEDVFVELDPTGLPNLDAVPTHLLLDDTRLVPIDVGPVCIDYDASWFARKSMDPPRTLEDLTRPEYAELLVLESPVTSTPGLVFLAATHQLLGDGAEAWWRNVLDGGALVVSGWTEAWYERYTVNGGDRPLVLSYASSPPAEVYYSDGSLDEPASGIVEGTCIEQVEYAGVLRGSANVDAATRVLNEMLGLEYQESLPLTNFVYPVRADARLGDLFERFAPRPTDSITLDAELVGKNRDRWVDEWRRIAG